VFGLANKASFERAEPAPPPRAAVYAPSVAAASVEQARTAASSRSIRLAPAAPLAANDAGGAVATRRETRVLGASTAPAAPAQALSRARGIGSRFRTAPDRHWETSK
jgi:type IV secretion system protein VirB6